MQQPIFFAAIASLGLHGILFAALPSLSPAAVSDDNQQRVPVVELGADDISRLPNFVDLDTPVVPDISDPYSFNLDSLEGLDDSDPLDQLLNDLDRVEPDVLSSSDLLRPLPPSTPLPAPISPSRTFPSWPFSSIPIPKPEPSPSPSPAQDSLPEDASGTSDSSEPEDVEPENNGSDSDAEPDDNKGPDRSDADADADPVDAESSPALSPEEAQATLAELLRYDGPLDENAYKKASDIARQNWIKLVEDENVPLADEPYITISSEYPKFACFLQTDDIGVTIAVFVDAANQVLENPAPIYLGRSWRKWFDDEALKLVRDYDFDNQTGTTTTYAVTVVFDYDAEKCPSLSAPSAPLPADPPEPSGQASSSPEGENNADEGNNDAETSDVSDSGTIPESGNEGASDTSESSGPETTGDTEPADTESE